MQADQADALVHQFGDGLEAVGLEERVAAAAVAVDDDGGRPGERRCRVLGPAVAIDFRGDAWNVIEAGLEQQAAGAVLVISGSVAGGPGQEDYLGVFRGRGEREEQDEQRAEDPVHGEGSPRRGAWPTTFTPCRRRRKVWWRRWRIWRNG